MVYSPARRVIVVAHSMESATIIRPQSSPNRSDVSEGRRGSDLTDFRRQCENQASLIHSIEEALMRLRSILLLAVAALLSDATGTYFAAHRKPPRPFTAAGAIFKIVPEDTRCPAATHVMLLCDTDHGTFLVFNNPKKRHNNLPGSSNMVRGEEDFEACPPYRLVHVKFLGRLSRKYPPPLCEPPTYP